MSELPAINTPQGGAVTADADPMFAIIERIALNPDLPMDRLSALMDMRERQMAKEAEQAFNQAFASAMGEMPDVPRSGENKHLRRAYSTLDDLIRTSRPVLARHGLSLNWETTVSGNTYSVTAVVRHAMGHVIQTTLQGERDKGSQMNHLQGGGSTESYLKRYTGFSILGLSSGDEVDDDGGAAVTTVSPEQFIELRDKLEESGMDHTKFYAAFGIKSPERANLQQFPASKFGDAMARLMAFIEKKAQKDD